MFSHLRRSVSSHPLVVDSFLAAFLAVLIGLGVIIRSPENSPNSQVIGWSLLAAAALPLAVRRKNPCHCLLATLALTVAGGAIAVPSPPMILPAAVALYTVGSVSSGRRMAVLFTAALAVAVVLGFTSRDDEGTIHSLVFHVAWTIGALALGVAVANRRAFVEQIRQRAIQAERTKEEEAQRRVDEERMRIARDVHDGVAHALASISIQASAGSTILDRDPEGARQVFRNIRTASSSALSELRSTLGLLRHEEEHSGAEGTDLAAIDRLAAVLRAEGIRVFLDGEASSWMLGGEPGAALHRILQESLTNILRHSGATEVEIGLRRSEDVVVLTVIDNGRGQALSEETRGYGLVGMRERAALLGGSVETGPRPGGGFQVRATLPLKEGS
jgi:signal transduction histidine kinase